MSINKDQVKGHTNEAIGKAKEVVGSVSREVWEIGQRMKKKMAHQPA